MNTSPSSIAARLDRFYAAEYGEAVGLAETRSPPWSDLAEAQRERFREACRSIGRQIVPLNVMEQAS